MKYTTLFPDGTSKTRTSKRNMKFSVIATSDGLWKDLSNHTTFELAEKSLRRLSKWGTFENLDIVPVVIND